MSSTALVVSTTNSKSASFLNGCSNVVSTLGDVATHPVTKNIAIVTLTVASYVYAGPLLSLAARSAFLPTYSFIMGAPTTFAYWTAVVPMQEYLCATVCLNGGKIVAGGLLAAQAAGNLIARSSQEVAGEPEQELTEAPEQTVVGEPEQAAAVEPEQAVAVEPEQAATVEPEQEMRAIRIPQRLFANNNNCLLSSSPNSFWSTNAKLLSEKRDLNNDAQKEYDTHCGLAVI